MAAASTIAADLEALLPQPTATATATTEAALPLELFAVDTPLGPMLGATRRNRLCLLEFADKNLAAHLDRVKKRFEIPCASGDRPVAVQVRTELSEYFAGLRHRFDVPLDLRGTPFQQRVWKALMDVPYARTRSYAAQAETLGSTKAIRAVARANGANPIAIVIPCHRILGSNGSLTGYAGGVWRKQWLLEHEQRHAPRLLPVGISDSNAGAGGSFIRP